jgi:predicted CxxxxCH...CXXCH cytochrome family protein
MYIKEYICYDNDETGGSVEEFVELTSPTSDGSFADGPPHTENVCEMCHTRTSHHQRDGDAPGGPSHFDSTRCTDCHLHNDGFKPVCSVCHEAPPPTGTHLKHFSGTEKQADYGSTLITQDFTSSSTEYIINCGNCHPIDVSRHMNEDLDNRPVLAEIELYDPNAPAGSLKALHPSTASYTPGATVFTDSSVLELNYTEGTCSDIYCHSGPSVMTTDEIPLPVPDPDTFYPLIYNPPWESLVVKSRHYQSPTWGGAPLSCSGCHEYPILSECVPEFDPDTGEFIRCTEVSAGAGDSHGWIDPGLIDEPGLLSLHVWNMGYDPLQCSTCHYATVRDFAPWTRDNFSIFFDDISIFNNSRHVNGTKDIQFTDIPVLYGNGAIHDLANATYDPDTSTCNDVSCHFKQTEVKWGTPYRWDLIIDDLFIECNICHRN